MPKDKFIGLRLDKKLRAELQRLARDERRPPSQMIRVLIEEAVEKRQKQMADAR